MWIRIQNTKLMNRAANSNGKIIFGTFGYSILRPHCVVVVGVCFGLTSARPHPCTHPHTKCLVDERWIYECMWCRCLTAPLRWCRWQSVNSFFGGRTGPHQWVYVLCIPYNAITSENNNNYWFLCLDKLLSIVNTYPLTNTMIIHRYALAIGAFHGVDTNGDSLPWKWRPG